ncbi:MAG: N-acetyltransferase [Pseudomonadota bacterium]
MTEKLEIRESRPDDLAALESLYPQAFPDEDLLPVVRDLLPDTTVTLSLVATMGAQITGHVIFTKCGVTGSSVNAALLGPLAVAPARQRQGVGTAIVRDGLRRLQEAKVSLVCVLGDPAYYGRLGFLRESSVEPPYPLPDEWDGAWQSRRLCEIAKPCTGRLSVPSQWLEPALWAP